MISSICACGVLFCLSMLARIGRVSDVGMLVYRLVISNEVRVELWGGCVFLLCSV